MRIIASCGNIALNNNNAAITPKNNVSGKFCVHVFDSISVSVDPKFDISPMKITTHGNTPFSTK